jgi:uncharacterized protein (TIGR00730 family)
MDKTIAVFGGNECVKEKEAYYFGLAYTMGALLAKSGFTVATGMGPGLMDQALKGAMEAGGKTFGVGVEVPGRAHSKYVTDSVMMGDLNSRQAKLIEVSDAYIALPGGVGTLYEISNILVFKNIKRLPEEKPLILVDGYYRALSGFLEQMMTEGFLRKEAKAFYKIVETPEEALDIMLKNFGS